MGLFKDCGCGCNGKIQEDKFIISIVAGLTFFIIANPETFRFVRSIFGSGIASPTGCPTTTGLMIHTVVFILIVWGMMNVKKTGKSKGPCGCKTKKKGTRTVISASDEPVVEEPPPVETNKVLESMVIDTQGTMF